MKTRIVKIGNSQGVRIPKILLEQSGLGEEVELEAQRDRLVIRPVSQAGFGWEQQFRDAMTVQVTLSEHELEELRALAERAGQTQDDLLREAVEQLVASRRQQDSQALLRQAEGMWKDRDDLPDLRELRREWARFER